MGTQCNITIGMYTYKVEYKFSMDIDKVLTGIRCQTESGEKMQLNITTDYAIRILLCLGEPGRVMAGPLIGEETNIPPKYIRKISLRLREAKLIDSMAGAQGGYFLTRPLKDISLLDVLSVMEPTTKINRCLEPDEFCSRGAAKDCPVRKFYQALQKVLEDQWLSVSLGMVVDTYGYTALPEKENAGSNEESADTADMDKNALVG